MTKSVTELTRLLDKVDSNIEDILKKMEPLKTSLNSHIRLKKKYQAQLRKVRSDDFEFLLTDPEAFEELGALLPKQLIPNGYRNTSDWKYREQSLSVRLGYKEEVDQATIEIIERWLKVTEFYILDVRRMSLNDDGVVLIKYESGVWKIGFLNYAGKILEEFTTESIRDMLDYVAKKHFATLD